MSDRAGTRKQASALAAQGERPIGTEPAGGVGAEFLIAAILIALVVGSSWSLAASCSGRFVFARTARQSLLEG